jgi:hypothetical protein
VVLAAARAEVAAGVVDGDITGLLLWTSTKISGAMYIKEPFATLFECGWFDAQDGCKTKRVGTKEKKQFQKRNSVL